MGNRLTEASELLNLASLSVALGEIEQATSYLLGGLDVAHDLASSYLLPGALAEAGRVLVVRGRTELGLQLIFVGERQYAIAGFTPDPGDDAFQDQRAAALAALPNERVEELLDDSAAMSLDDAVALARTELGS